MWISPPFYFQFRCFLFLNWKLDCVKFKRGYRFYSWWYLTLMRMCQIRNKTKKKKREAVNKRERDWKRLSKLNGLLCMRGPALSPLTKIIHESRNKVHSTSIIFQKVTNRTKKKKKITWEIMLRCWFHYMATTCCQWTWRLGWFRYHLEDEKHSMNHHLG